MNRKTIPFILILYLIPLSVLVLWTDFFSSMNLRGQLTDIMPWSLEVNFLLLCAAAYAARSVLLDLVLAIPRRAQVMALGLSVVAFVLAAFIAPRTHRVYYDEDIYLNIGQNIGELKKASMCLTGVHVDGEYRCEQYEYNKEPYAWPYLISLAFRAFGVGENRAFGLNNGLFALMTLCVFLIGYLLSDDPRVGLYAAGIYSVIPKNVLWFSTTSAEPSTACFGGFAVLSVLLFLKRPAYSTLFLLSTMLPFAAQFRPESVLIWGVALTALLLWRPEGGVDFWDIRYHAIFALGLLLLVPQLTHLYAVRMEDWGSSSAAKLSTIHFLNNLKVNGPFYLNNAKFPVFTTILAVWALLSRQSWREKLFLTVWFLPFWGIFLFFYAGSYGYGTDVRFSLMSYAPLALLAGWGAYALERLFMSPEARSLCRACLCLAIVSQALSFLPMMRVVGEEAWSARSDHFYAEKMAQSLPVNSMVLTHNPNMFLLWGKNAGQTSTALNRPVVDQYFQRFKGGVFFHHNAWCDYLDPVQNKLCQDVMDNFKTELLESYQERDNFKYQLYRLSSK